MAHMDRIAGGISEVPLQLANCLKAVVLGQDSTFLRQKHRVCVHLHTAVQGEEPTLLYTGQDGKQLCKAACASVLQAQYRYP